MFLSSISTLDPQKDLENLVRNREQNWQCYCSNDLFFILSKYYNLKIVRRDGVRTSLPKKNDTINSD